MAIRFRYHFTGYISLMPQQYIDIDKTVQAYTNKQSYFQLALALAPELHIAPNKLYLLLLKSKTLKSTIVNSN